MDIEKEKISEMIQRTLVLVKPDGVSRHLVGEIIKRFEQRGIKIIGLKMLKSDSKKAAVHYNEEIEKRYGRDVRNRLIEYINEGPIVALALEGIDCVNVARKICGSTYPNEAAIGTIRGDFAHMSKDYANQNLKNVKNLVHASGNLEEAKTEIKIWFKEDELYSYDVDHDKYV